MTPMLLHIDGSSVKSTTGGRKYAIGWGIVAHYADLEAEVQGALRVGQHLTGYHEIAAFVEAVLYAKARGYGPDDVVIYTDDEVVAYAAWALHPGNYQVTKADALRGRLRTLTSALYCDATYELVLEYLHKTRIHKLRGHSFLIYQERADYLAKQSAWGVLEVPQPAAQSFSEWLANGLDFYVRDATEPSKWHAPFVTPAVPASTPKGVPEELAA